MWLRISPFVILIIVIAVVILILWAVKTRTKKVEYRGQELSTSAQCKICGQDNLPEARFCANCGAALVTEAETPESPPASLETPGEYAGFWIRFAAAVIDGAILTVATIFTSGFGIILFWLYFWLFTGLKGQTLGKMVLSIKVINAEGDIPTLGIAALREILGKTLSAIALFIGLLWIIWDEEKRGWHDIIANTRVVKVVKAKSEE